MTDKLLITMMLCLACSSFAANVTSADVVSKQQEIRTLMDNEKFAEAESQASLLLEQYPNDIDVQMLMAHVYYREGKYEAARDLLVKIEKQAPNSQDAADLRGALSKKITMAPAPSTPAVPPQSAILFAPQNLQATNILNNVVTDYRAFGYGSNQIGFNQQSIYARR